MCAASWGAVDAAGWDALALGGIVMGSDGLGCSRCGGLGCCSLGYHSCRLGCQRCGGLGCHAVGAVGAVA